LEDTVSEVYHAINQLIEKAAGIASIYRGFIVIAIPMLEEPERIISPLQRFFYKTRKFNVRREFWLFEENRIIKIIASGAKPSPFLEEISEVIEVRVKANGEIPIDEKIALINKLNAIISKK